MERDALEVAGIMLKKFGGIDLKTMSNREKTIVIDALKEKYRLDALFKMLDLSKAAITISIMRLLNLIGTMLIESKSNRSF